jgi:histidinol-phosphatase (PHP family)
MHTPLCGHAVGEPEAYCRHAIQLGLREIGFSDHAPLVAYHDPSVTMAMADLPKYYRMIEDVRARFAGQLRVKIGLEADYIPGYEDQTRAIIEDYPYDYVIGSVHFIRDWGFDNPAQMNGWKQRDIDEVYQTYYTLLQQSAQSGLFDIMGHVDLVKKFGHRPVSDFKEVVRRTASVFKACGVAIEINTAGLRKPVKEMYPSTDILAIYRETGVPLTFGSDAHQPQDVGCDFDQALELARAVGYQEYALFCDRKLERTVPINDEKEQR